VLEHPSRWLRQRFRPISNSISMVCPFQRSRMVHLTMDTPSSGMSRWSGQSAPPDGGENRRNLRN
jgi:hypothetical protein